jgi:hypothetical protein
VVLSEAEAEKSIEEGMSALEQLLRFGPDPTLERALPHESVVPPPPTGKTLGLTVGVGGSTGAQEATKVATPEGPLVQVGSAVGGRSRVEETATGGPNVVEAEVVSVSSDEPSDLAKGLSPPAPRAPQPLRGWGMIPSSGVVHASPGQIRISRRHH